LKNICRFREHLNAENGGKRGIRRCPSAHDFAESLSLGAEASLSNIRTLWSDFFPTSGSFALEPYRSIEYKLLPKIAFASSTNHSKILSFELPSSRSAAAPAHSPAEATAAGAKSPASKPPHETSALRPY